MKQIFSSLNKEMSDMHVTVLPELFFSENSEKWEEKWKTYCLVVSALIIKAIKIRGLPTEYDCETTKEAILRKLDKLTDRSTDPKLQEIRRIGQDINTSNHQWISSGKSHICLACNCRAEKCTVYEEEEKVQKILKSASFLMTICSL